VSDYAHDEGRLLARVTNAVVHLYREHFGKGPTRSKSYLTTNLLFCVMGDLFTTAERTLIAAGEGDRVRAARLAVSDAIEAELRATVERILERRVLTSTSQVLLEPEIGMVVFVLEPASAAAPAD
jgi:uncharacterized protein YbcI